MATLPHAGHPTKEDSDEQGQIGDCDHSLQHRERGVGKPGIRCFRAVIISHCSFCPDFEGVIRHECRF
jgi:hypothetical protein